MPRAPGRKIVEAEKLFHGGMAMVDIARKLDVSDGTVRSWKNRYGWGDASKKNDCSVAKKIDKKNATMQKKKRGGQPQNKNAKGASGNPNPNQPPDRTKHGGYVPVFMDALDEEEQELVECIPEDEETLLIEQIQLFSIRERRILRAMNKYRSREEQDECLGVSRLEQELSTVQSKKTKAIETLARLHLEKQKMEGNATGNELVKEWAERIRKARGVPNE